MRGFERSGARAVGGDHGRLQPASPNMWSGHRIVVVSSDRHSAQQVAHSIGVSRPTVWRWQQRFAESGVEGLLRDKTRKPGKAPIAAETSATATSNSSAFSMPSRREVPAKKVIHTVLDNYATPAGRTAKKRDRSSRSCGGAERERLSAVYAVQSVILFGVTTTHCLHG
jgi:hypothetical protein